MKKLHKAVFLMAVCAVLFSVDFASAGYEQDRYNPFWRFNESAADSEFDNVPWEAMDTAAKSAWFQYCASIDRTDEHAYIPGQWVCLHFATQTYINFGGNPPGNLPDVYDDPQWSTPNRFNLPLYEVTVAGTGYGHSINAILIGDNPLNFSDWYFFEPQNDHQIQPGQWDMPYDKKVILHVPTHLSDSGGYLQVNLIKWYIHGDGEIELEWYKDTLVTQTDWSANTGRWDDASNWTNAVPDAHKIARINNGKDVEIDSAATCTGLMIGQLPGQSGSVQLSATGQLTSGKEFIGAGGTGTFIQAGGVNSIEKDLIIGLKTDASGSYQISAGTLQVGGKIAIGPVNGGGGVLEVSESANVHSNGFIAGFGNDDAILKLTNADNCSLALKEISFGPNGYLYVENTTGKPAIHCQTFDIQSADEQHFDLDRIAFIFSNTFGLSGTLEAASAIAAGFDNNFAIGKLVVDGGFELALVDEHDNGNRGVFGKECLFVEELEIAPDSSIDIGDFYLYVQGNVEGQLQEWIDEGRLFSSSYPTIDAIYVSSKGWTQVVPEPGCILLMIMGSIFLLRRSKD